MEDEGSGDEEDEDLKLSASLVSPDVYAIAAGSPGVLDLRQLRVTPSLDHDVGGVSEGQESFARPLASAREGREHHNLVGPWSDNPGSPVVEGEPTPQVSKLFIEPRQLSTLKPHAPAGRRPTSATHRPSSAKRQSPAAPRPVSATTRPTSARPGSAKRGSADDFDSELLSSANIAAARYYAGLGEGSARKRLVAGDSYLGDRERDRHLQESPEQEQKVKRSFVSTPEWTPTPRRHLRSQPQREECLMETPTGFCALRIPGFSQRLTQTEKVPRKSLLQKVMERGGGSALSFGSSLNDIDLTGRKGQPHHGQDGSNVIRMGKSRAGTAKSRRASKNDLPMCAKGRQNSNSFQTGQGSLFPTPRYPYYKDRNKGKEKDGEQVGLKVLPLRVSANARAPSAQTQGPGQRPMSDGFVRKGNGGKTVHIERRPLSAVLDDNIPSPPADSRKKGAITIAELDRQLRLLEIQAKAAAMGGPPLQVGPKTQEADYQRGFDASVPELTRRSSGRMVLHPPPLYSPLATPRDRNATGRGGDSVLRQGSRGSLLSRGGGVGTEMDGDALFEIWSFQGKFQSFRRPEALLGEAGKESEMMHERPYGIIKSLAHAPPHSVLKGTGGAPSFSKTRFADQSILLRGNSIFHKMEDLGNFLSAKDLALVEEEGLASERALAAAVEAGDQLGQSLKERMVESSLLQQMEQQCHAAKEFLWSRLDNMEMDGYENADAFLQVWEASSSGGGGGERGAAAAAAQDEAEGKTVEVASWTKDGATQGGLAASFSPVPQQVRREICEDVWVAMAERNSYLKPGVLNHFIPDLIPENMEYNEQTSVSTLLRIVLDRSAERWWENDVVVAQFREVSKELPKGDRERAWYAWC